MGPQQGAQRRGIRHVRPFLTGACQRSIVCAFCHACPDRLVIASGGVRHELDAAKAIAWRGYGGGGWTDAGTFGGG